MSKLDLVKTIVIVFVVTLFFSLAISLPVKSTAASMIGSHLGYGDINHQISIMDGILAPNGAGSGFPVTLMVEINTSAEDVGRLAAAVQRHGFFPIVRINRVCDGNTQDSINIVNIVKEKFGASVLITFGNEVNNQARECADPNTYANNYRAVAGMGNISPAALDWYNYDYPADAFLSSTGLAGDYNAANIRTANAYGCIGQSADSCDPNATDTHQVGMTGTEGKNLILSEFSLSPGGDSPPDTNLDNVIQFIETQGSQTGASHITPLVRNVCENFQDHGEWLLYVHGTLYTGKGQRIDPQNCEALDRLSALKERDHDQFITYPLNMIEKEQVIAADYDPEKPRDYAIFSLVKDQGYQTYCPSPELEISSKFVGEVQKYFEIHPQPPIGEVYLGINPLFSGTVEQKANMADAKVALFRGSELETDTAKNSSFEGFFGALNLEEEKDVRSNGAANFLLSLGDKCFKKVSNLRTAKELCEMLDEPKSCALYQEIPETDFLIYSHDPSESMLMKYEGLAQEINDRVGGELGFDRTACSVLSQPYNPELGIDKDQFREVQDAMGNMSLNLERVYRTAFLVISVLQQPKNDPEGDKYDIFSFLYKHTTGDGEGGAKIQVKDAPLHIPLVVAFKIPDFTTNKAQSMPWSDTADISASTLRSKEDSEQIQGEEMARREALLAEIKRMQILEASDDPIARSEVKVICSGTPQCDGAPEALPLARVLVDIINGSNPKGIHFSQGNGQNIMVESNNCERHFYFAEQARDIAAPAFVPDGRESVPQTNQFEEGLWSGYDALGAPPHNKVDFDFKIKVTGPSQKERTEVQIHIVAPIGANLKVIEKSLQAFFAAEDFENMVEANRIADWEDAPGVPENLPVIDAKFGAEGGDSIEFDRRCWTDESGVEHCEERKFGVKMKQDHKGLYMPGARLGWMLRKIQTGLREFGSKAYEYVKSCERTEDMFLGRCSGKSETIGFGSTPYNGRNEDLGWSEDDQATRCQEAPAGSPCSVDNMINHVEKWAADHGEQLEANTIRKRAQKASIICNAESGGNASTVNDGCVTGKSVDYSVGLFQINLLAHECDNYFDYNWTPPSCNILVEQSLVDDCADKMQDPTNNINYALNLSNGGQNWGAWSTGSDKYCGQKLKEIDGG
ncbi:MAG: hypothetical protein PVJ09_04315 [Candidatus Woesebacteria bacterium]